MHLLAVPAVEQCLNYNVYTTVSKLFIFVVLLSTSGKRLFTAIFTQTQFIDLTFRQYQLGKLGFKNIHPHKN
jgi:hypothetical protein